MTKKDKDKPNRAWAEALDTRLKRLEAALATLASVPAGQPDPQTDAQSAPETGDPAEPGRIRLSVRMPGTDWRQDTPAATLLSCDWPALAPRLAALGHPARLAILRAVLGGASDAPSLMQAAGATTPGQLYHHLRELTAAGWLTAPRRGAYAVPQARMGALLAAVALARDEGGTSRRTP
jgi:DNA-binding transcriptional ArsR family regulator